MGPKFRPQIGLSHWSYSINKFNIKSNSIWSNLSSSDVCQLSALRQFPFTFTFSPSEYIYEQVGRLCTFHVQTLKTRRVPNFVSLNTRTKVSVGISQWFYSVRFYSILFGSIGFYWILLDCRVTHPNIKCKDELSRLLVGALTLILVPGVSLRVWPSVSDKMRRDETRWVIYRISALFASLYIIWMKLNSFYNNNNL